MTEDDLTPRQRALAGEFGKEGHSVADAIQMASLIPDVAQAVPVMDREQVAKVFAYIWHGDLGEWQGFLSKADAFLAYPFASQPSPAATVEPVLSGLHEDLILMSFHNEPEPAPHNGSSAGNEGAIEISLSECRDFLTGLVGGARFDIKADHHAKDLIEQADIALASQRTTALSVRADAQAKADFWASQAEKQPARRDHFEIVSIQFQNIADAMENVK